MITYLMRNTITSILLFISLLSTAYAQNENIDPLQNPKIWSELKEDPHNDVLWAKYMGKDDLFSLTKQEWDTYEQWKAVLLRQLELKEEEVKYKKEEFKHGDSRYTDRITDRYYQNLLVNLYKNFTLIDEFFKIEYKKVEHGYDSYYILHPDEVYDKGKWIRDHEAKLVKLRNEKEQEERLKKQIELSNEQESDF